MPVKITQKEWVERATKKHNGFYDYSKSFYTLTNKKITIICPIHGEFEQVAHSHLHGKGCRKCFSSKRAHTIKEFKSRATKTHNGLYDYSKSFYTTRREKLIIICPIHGEFEQRAYSHLDGVGCMKCCRVDTEIFIERATKTHNGLYDYSKSFYTLTNKKITIICPAHGEFEQIANSHLQGKGCDKCSHRISKGEIMWLNFLCIPD